MISALPPHFYLLLGALFAPMLKGKKQGALLLFPALALVSLASVPLGAFLECDFLGFTLTLVEIDKLSKVFSCIFSITAFVGLLYNLHANDRLENTAGLAYAGCASGVVFAGDFFTFFVFWELLTVCAVFFIWNGKRKDSVAAGYRYLLFHVVGGLILLAGIILRVRETGSIEFGEIGLSTPATYLIFLGMGINAAWPALHSWVVDAYPTASPGGIVFLSALTTKTAVYALIRGFPGAEPLIWIGCVMLSFPVFFAVIENDLRKVLSYSLLNQVGFMMVGIGIGTELSLNGAVAHAFTHILYKSLLFMSMGAVLHRVGSTKATQLGGLWKSMPITTVCCLIGAASISGIPGFSGFISKSMVVSAAGHEHLFFVWLALLFASAGVLEHAGIKVPFFSFFGHDSGIRVKEAPTNMLLAMGVTAFLCTFLGLAPTYLYQALPFEVHYEPHTLDHWFVQIQLLSFAGLAFCFLLLAGMYPPERRAVNLDVDWFYRGIFRTVYRISDWLTNGLNSWANTVFVNKFTRGLNSFFEAAPLKIATAFCVPYWKSAAVSSDSIDTYREGLERAFDRATMPVGVTAVMTLVVFMVLFLI